MRRGGVVAETAKGSAAVPMDVRRAEFLSPSATRKGRLSPGITVPMPMKDAPSHTVSVANRLGWFASYCHRQRLLSGKRAVTMGRSFRLNIH